MLTTTERLINLANNLKIHLEKPILTVLPYATGRYATYYKFGLIWLITLG